MKNSTPIGKYLQISALIFGLFIGQITFAATILEDIKPTSPQFEAISDLNSSGALKTDSKGNFNPDQLILKAEFYEALFKYINYEPKTNTNYFTGFNDIPSNNSLAGYIKKALEMKAISVSENKKFNPQGNINRGEALSLVLAIYGIPTPLSNPKQAEIFKDIKPSSAISYLYSAAKKYSIYFSNNPDYFYPAKKLTRADAAELLYKTKHAELNQNNDNLLIKTISNTGGNSSQLVENDKFQILLDVWNKINDQYIYPERINQNELLYGAISGMVERLHDPYSIFQEPVKAVNFSQHLNGEFEGIGIIIEYTNNEYIIQTNLENSPAEKAGLKSKDLILEIDGKEIKKLQPSDVTTLIKGKAGTQVKLKIQRDKQILNFTITRAIINLAPIKYKMLENSIGYINISQFTDTIEADFNKSLATLLKQNPEKLIIDLRNNPGGYLVPTQKILEHFIPKGEIILFTQNVQQEISPYVSTGKGELSKYPIIVLINEGSASAAEIMAGALKENKIAKIIGTKSFGKGTVQEISVYKDNSALKISIAKWLTPNKNTIDHQGVTPDIEIKQDEKNPNVDVQLNKAIEEIKKM